MSETSTTIEPNTRSAPRPYPRMLPQWAIDIVRPLIRLFCRSLWRIRWLGTEHIPLTGGLIIAANHQTYLDPFWVGCVVKRPIRFLAWDAVFNWPLVGRAIRLLGAWPLQLEGIDPGPIRRSMQFVRDGGSVMIFPEGGRGNSDGSMKRFKPGAVRMALETGAPILPVTIRGGHLVWPSTYHFPRLRRVEIIYHPPIAFGPLEGEEPRACARRETETLAEIVRSTL